MHQLPSSNKPYLPIKWVRKWVSPIIYKFSSCKLSRGDKNRIFRLPNPSNPKNGRFQAVLGVLGPIYRDFSSFFAFRRTWMRFFAVLRRLLAYSPQLLRRLSAETPLTAYSRVLRYKPSHRPRHFVQNEAGGRSTSYRLATPSGDAKLPRPRATRGDS